MENYVYLIIAEADCPLNIVWRQQKNVCQYSKKERKTTGVNRVNIISCKQMWGLDDKMMEETRNKWTLSKDKIEWDAVETIPILLYTDNFTLLSVYKEV